MRPTGALSPRIPVEGTPLRESEYVPGTSEACLCSNASVTPEHLETLGREQKECPDE